MLSRFRAVQAAEAGHPLIKQQERRRPAYPRDDMSLYDCDQYRLECVREISRKVSQIQNGTHRGVGCACGALTQRPQPRWARPASVN